MAPSATPMEASDQHHDDAMEWNGRRRRGCGEDVRAPSRRCRTNAGHWAAAGAWPTNPGVIGAQYCAVAAVMTQAKRRQPQDHRPGQPFMGRTRFMPGTAPVGPRGRSARGWGSRSCQLDLRIDHDIGDVGRRDVKRKAAAPTMLTPMIAG